jgi:hypothetical protein
LNERAALTRIEATLTELQAENERLRREEGLVALWQLVSAGGALQRAAMQIEYALANRQDGTLDADTGLRTARAYREAEKGLIELRRVWQRYERQRVAQEGDGR